MNHHIGGCLLGFLVNPQVLVILRCYNKTRSIARAHTYSTPRNKLIRYSSYCVLGDHLKVCVGSVLVLGLFMKNSYWRHLGSCIWALNNSS